MNDGDGRWMIGFLDDLDNGACSRRSLPLHEDKVPQARGWLFRKVVFRLNY